MKDALQVSDKFTIIFEEDTILYSTGVSKNTEYSVTKLSPKMVHFINDLGYHDVIMIDYCRKVNDCHETLYDFNVGDIIRVLNEEKFKVVQRVREFGCVVIKSKPKSKPLYEIYEDLTKISSKPTITRGLGIYWCSNGECTGHGSTALESYNLWISLLEKNPVSLTKTKDTENNSTLSNKGVF
jgi:predicted glycosyltransferase